MQEIHEARACAARWNSNWWPAGVRWLLLAHPSRSLSMHVLRHLVTYDPNSVRRVSPHTVLWESDEESSVASDMDEAMDGDIPVHAVDVVQQLDQSW